MSIVTTAARVLGLRYEADIRTLSFFVLYIGLLAWMWRAHDTSRLGTVAWSLLWWTLTYLSFVGAAATHNTIHCAMFKHYWGNAFMRVALTIWYGHPCSAFVPGHNLSHHRYTQMVNDLMQTSVTQHNPNILNLFLFHPRIVSRVMKGDINYMLWMGTKGRRMFQEWLTEGLALILVTVMLLLTSPRKWLYYFMVPHYVAQFAIVTINLLQHDGCDVVLPRTEDDVQHDGDMYEDHIAPTLYSASKIISENALSESIQVTPQLSAAGKLIPRPVASGSASVALAPTFKQRIASFNTARNFVGPALNWMLMNNGYHTIHHHRPYLHWSLLKEAHEREVKPHIHPALDQQSMLVYLFRSYISPGTRIDYLGQPVTFDRTMEESACGDWMNVPADEQAKLDAMDTKQRLRFVADGALVLILKIISPLYSPFAKMD